LPDAVAARVEFIEAGGASRDSSVANGLDAIASRSGENDWILVHDAARCGITAQMIADLIVALRDDPVGGLMAVPVADTIKRVSNDAGIPARRSVMETVERASLWQAQTPQMFRYGLLRDALAAAHRAERIVTDESSAVEALGHRPCVVAGASRNFKVTTAEDLHLMELLLRADRIRA
jgi:2-C-methyl-D-erythritol 4-phosphate cytidylyltransferase